MIILGKRNLFEIRLWTAISRDYFFERLEK